MSFGRTRGTTHQLSSCHRQRSWYSDEFRRKTRIFKKTIYKQHEKAKKQKIAKSRKEKSVQIRVIRSIRVPNELRLASHVNNHAKKNP
jgi:hypothetical protein